MKLSQLKQVIREEVKAALNEASNPELDRSVQQFVKGLASKYGYKSSDAVMAIFEALKRLNMIHSDVNYKAPSGFSIAESVMADLGVLMDEASSFEDFLNKLRTNPAYKSFSITPEVQDFLQDMWEESGRQ